MSALGFKGGTRSDTEWNQWVAYEKEKLAEVMLQYDIEWEKKGTHEKHLSVLDFEKKERIKEVDKLLADKGKLENQQKKLQQEINRMAQSKEKVERKYYTYDEGTEWQLPEPGKLMSAKAYHDKKVQPLVKKLKEEARALMFKCIQLVEEKEKLDTQVSVQGMQIKRLTDKIMMQKDNLDEFQEKMLDLKRLEHYLGREQMQIIVEQLKQQEKEERANKRRKHIFEMER